MLRAWHQSATPQYLRSILLPSIANTGFDVFLNLLDGRSASASQVVHRFLSVTRSIQPSVTREQVLLVLLLQGNVVLRLRQTTSVLVGPELLRNLQMEVISVLVLAVAPTS